MSFSQSTQHRVLLVAPLRPLTGAGAWESGTNLLSTALDHVPASAPVLFLLSRTFYMSITKACVSLIAKAVRCLAAQPVSHGSESRVWLSCSSCDRE